MIIDILVLIILILVNAFFAGSEIAYITLNDYTLEEKARKGNKKAKKIQALLKDSSKFLSLIQVGVTIAGFMASAVASDTFVEKIMPLFAGFNINQMVLEKVLMVIITIITSFLSLIFGELVPKKISMNYAEPIAYATVDILYVIDKIFKPFIIMLTKITDFLTRKFEVTEDERKIVIEEQIKAMLESGVREGSVKDDEKNVIINALELNDKKVKNIMTPIEYVVEINVNTDMKTLIKYIQRYKFSRMPVFKKSKKNVIGIIHIKDLLTKVTKSKGALDLEDIVRPVMRTTPMKRIDKLFVLMKRSKNHICIVENSKKEMIGIITLEDIMEELVGEIYDEYDNYKEKEL